MHVKNFSTATDLLLQKELEKKRNLQTFNRFVNLQATKSKENYNAIIGNATVNNSHSSFETKIEEDGTIITTEYEKIPFVFVQSETILKPDGSNIHTIYYASQERIPAKVVSYSAQSMISRTTLYDTKGQIKTQTKVMTFADNSRVEEKFEANYNRKTKTFFNKYNISTAVESYVDDKLVFKLECDNNGNLQKEYNYNNNLGATQISKEIIYHKNEDYTVKEYTSLGNVYSCNTKALKR